MREKEDGARTSIVRESNFLHYNTRRQFEPVDWITKRVPLNLSFCCQNIGRMTQPGASCEPKTVALYARIDF